MSKHEYKPGDKVTFAVSREHFVENVAAGEEISRDYFDAPGVATVEDVQPGGLHLKQIKRSDYIGVIYSYGINAIKPYSEPTNLTPETDRERMLCDAVIAMERGIKLVMKSAPSADWQSFHDRVILVDDDIEYTRAAPKLPEIPWEWIDDGVSEIEIRSDLFIMRASDGLEVTYEVNPFKLDLTGVTLPVTVKRPD